MKCEFIDQWRESLLWTPSQLFRRARCGPYIFTLYLRWRYEDPWQFYVALGDMSSDDTRRWEFITDDLFQRYGVFFRDEEYKEAEKRAEELFVQSADDIIKDMYEEIRRAVSRCGLSTHVYDSFKLNIDVIKSYIESWRTSPSSKIGVASALIDRLLQVYAGYEKMASCCTVLLGREILKPYDVRRIYNIITIIFEQVKLYIAQFLAEI